MGLLLPLGDPEGSQPQGGGREGCGHASSPILQAGNRGSQGLPVNGPEGRGPARLACQGLCGHLKILATPHGPGTFGNRVEVLQWVRATHGWAFLGA